jgi:hypothetical protein
MFRRRNTLSNYFKFYSTKISQKNYAVNCTFIRDGKYAQEICTLWENTWPLRFPLAWLVELILVPCEQQVLIELAINSGDFWWLYVMFQRENHFINKRLQKPRVLNLKCIPAVNNVNKTNRNRYNSQSWKFYVNFFFTNWISYCCSSCILPNGQHLCYLTGRRIPLHTDVTVRQRASLFVKVHRTR